jgi:phage repressor protein C with HTH and peptisase S24 domain
MIFRIGGDFMEPTLREGDFALVDRKSRDPRDGGIYVLKFAGGTTCRRIQVMKNRTLLAKSDNSLYEPLSIDLTKDKDVVFVGRVIWAGKSMG